MRPGERLISWLIGLLAAGLLVPLAPEVAWLLVAGLAILLAGFTIEARTLRQLQVTAERQPIVALSLGEEEVIDLRVSTNARAPIHLRVRQVWSRLVTPESTTRMGHCRPGEVLALSLPIRSVARGSEPLPPPHIAATYWGLAERILTATGTGELRVLPNLRAVQRLHRELNRFALTGLGARTAAHIGKGREFDRLREYVPDDDYRDIAWKASARHRKLIVREWRLDRSQDILVCLDRGHRMAARVTHLSRLDHAVNAAVLLGYICNRMEDRLGLVGFAANVESGISPGRGAIHLRQLTAYSATLQPDYAHTDYLTLAAQLRHRLHRRTLILILTALPETDTEHTLARAVERLTPKHLALVVVLTDPALAAAASMLPADKAELSRVLVARGIIETRAIMTMELRRLGALVVETTPHDAGVDAVNAYIDVKRRQLL